jgi:hypothetical protein
MHLSGANACAGLYSNVCQTHRHLGPGQRRQDFEGIERAQVPDSERPRAQRTEAYAQRQV